MGDHPASPDVQDLLSQLSQQKFSDSNDAAQIIKLCRSLLIHLEDPAEKAFELFFSFVIQPCMCVAADLDLFAKLNDGPKTAMELSKLTGADEMLIVRIMRVIAGIRGCEMLGTEQYGPTPVSRFFSLPGISAAIKHVFDMGFRPCASLPEFLRETKYAYPDDSSNTIVKHFFGMSYFAKLENSPRESANFNAFMAAFRHLKQPWTKLFPAEPLFYEGFEESRSSTADNGSVVVDVAGGFGHDLNLIRNTFTKVPSKLVLQDMSGVIQTVPEDLKTGIALTVHDMFKPQPVKNARVYILKSVLHDWPKAEALEILQRIVPAMKLGFSKIWIIDRILSDSEVPLIDAELDITMMMAFSSLERTYQQWKDLLDAAGLRITHLVRLPDSDGFIEATL